MKKKLLSILLALCMVLSSTGFALAADTDQAGGTGSDQTGAPQESTEDAELQEYLEDLEPYTEENVNLYTPSEQKNLLLADGTADDAADDTEEEDVPDPDTYVAGEVLFSRELGGLSLSDGGDLEEDLAALGISGVEEVAVYEETVTTGGLSLQEAGTETVWYSAKVSGDVLEAVAALEEMDGIEHAEPNYIYTTDSCTEPDESEISASWSYSDLHCHDDGSEKYHSWWKDCTESEGRDINPGTGTVVAVIDTGVDYTHNDLAANMWINAGEIADNGIDDDGNGYIDDVYGANVLATGAKAGDPQDDHGHGTHVAGIIAMTAGNGEGSVGVAYGTKIMAVKAGQSNGVFTSASIAKAINYAHQMGADVINMSFGGEEQSYLMEQALQSAFADCVLVAAAGNDGKATTDAIAYGFLKNEVEDFYPAGYTYVLGVMATNEYGYLASFSNFDFISFGGPAEYELTAPGVNIYSTLPGNRYASWSGTSMAAPQVAAAAAVLRSYYSNKDTYSTRFIYGQLASATEDNTYYIDKHLYGHVYGALNIEDSLENTPTPRIKVTDVYALDPVTEGTDNDGDSVIDAGEVIDLGISIRNQWSQTGTITVKADAVSDGGVVNPNIEWITDTITLDPAGTYAEQDNGETWEDGLLTGVSNPLQFRVKADTPNDYQIKIHLTVTTTNGLDSSDTNTYTAEASFTFIVVSGIGIRGELTRDKTLDNDHYWIIENTLLVDEGVTLTVEPGTQIQFWSTDYEGAYGGMSMAAIINNGTLNMIGTEDQPISMFPGSGFNAYTVEISGSGVETLQYCEIVNPRLGYTGANTCQPVDIVDHCRLTQDEPTNTIRYLSDGTVKIDDHAYYAWFGFYAAQLSNSVLQGFYGSYTSSYKRNIFTEKTQNTLFNECSIDMSQSDKPLAVNRSITDSVYLDDTSAQLYGATPILKVRPDYDEAFYYYDPSGSKYIFISQLLNTLEDFRIGGLTYSEILYDQLLDKPYEQALMQALAESMGGTLLCLDDSEEENFIFGTMHDLSETTRQEGDTTTISRDYYIGYTYDETQKQYVWADGSTYAAAADKYNLTSARPYGYLSCSSSTTAAWKSLNGSSNCSDYGYILEVPASLTDEAIRNAIDSFDYDGWLRERYPSGMRNCAVLNPVLNTTPSTWAAVTAGSYDRNLLCYDLSGNYWGTEKSTLINKMITDADDYAGTLANIEEEPILTLQSESLADIYPFTTSVWLEDSDGNIVSSVSPGTTYEVHVTYNRDMDPDTQPTITYGPAVPYNDYTVQFDHWASAREWVGTTTISPVMTAGTMYFKTTGGCAADDHWLVCGDDVLRFQFTVSATGALAMLLQASGGANKVDLTWAQNDYDTLAGYNLYRSTSADGTFTKINSTIVTGTSYTDTDVEPGVTYYYYFKVVNTAGTEEAAISNTASAAPKDNVKPTLTHTKVTSAKAGAAVTLSAVATDNIGVTEVKAYYRVTGAAAYTALNLIAGEDNRYVGVIPASAVTAAGLQYYITASDADGNITYSGTAQLPNTISVNGDPYISGLVYPTTGTSGGTTVTILGGSFTSDMTLKVGGVKVDTYSLIDSGTITFIAPAKSLGAYAVTLTTAAGYTATTTSTLVYSDGAASAQIPTSMEATAGLAYEIPLYVSLTGELTALHAELTLPADSFTSVTVAKADSSASYTLLSNWSDGVLKISCSGSADFNPGSDTPLLKITVTPAAVETASRVSVALQNVAFNGTAITDLISGDMTVSPIFSLKAQVLYYVSDAPVRNITVKAGGVTAVTDASGEASLTGITASQVTVTASCNTGVSSDREIITVMDAVEILKSCVDLTTLSDAQKLAADVDGDGDVDEVDASCILKYVVELIDTFPAGYWKFSPVSVSKTLTSAVDTVSFSAILVGDVNGSWKEAEE